MARKKRLWKITLLLAAAATLAVLLTVLYLWRSDSVDRFARSRIIQFLESKYHVKVEIDSVRVDLKKNRAILRGIKVNNQRYPSDPPPIHIQEVEVEFMYSLLGRTYRFGDVFVRTPTVRVLPDPNGYLNLTNMFEPRQKTEVRFSLANVGTISIENGNIFYMNQWIPLETRGGGLQSRFFYSPADDIYRLELSLGELALTKAQQRLRALKLQADFRLKNEVFSFRKLDFQSDLGELHSSDASFNYHSLEYRLRGNGRINLNRLTYAGFQKAGLHGVVAMSGIVRGVKTNFEFAGRFNSNRFVVRQYAFNRLSGDLSADSSRVLSNNLRGEIFGAPFSARLSLALSDGKTSQAEVSVRGARIEAFLPRLNIPFSNISGSADARLVLQWPGLKFENSTGSGALSYSGRITAASDVRRQFPGSLSENVPYQGSVSVTKRGSSLDLQHGIVTTPASRIDYSGNITLAGAYDLKVKLHSANADELIRAAGLFDSQIRRQLQQREIRSNASFDFQGTLSGNKSQYRLAGNVVSPLLQVKHVSLSNIKAAVELTPRFVRLDNASVQFGSSRITGSIRYPFVAAGERIQVEANVQNAQLQDLMALVNSNLPVGGLLNARIRVSGLDLLHMEGTSQVVVDRPTFFGEPFDRLTADLTFSGAEYDVQNLRLVKGRGLVTGTISGRTDSKSLNVDLAGRDLQLTSIQTGNLKGYQLGGVLSFTIRGNGTLDNLNHTLHAEIRGFLIQGEQLQNLVVDAKAEGKRVDFTAVTNYLNNRLEARGHVLVTDDYPFQAAMDLRNAPIRPYIALIGKRPNADLSGLATGRVQASGKLKRLEDSQVEARLSSLQLVVNRYQLRNQGEVVLRFEQGVLDIKPVKLVGPDTSLTLSGQVSTLGTQPVSLRISGNANLIVLSGLVPDLSARGNVSLNVYASGSIQQIKVLGSANFDKVYLAQPGWPTPLFDTSGSLRFTANQVSIESITAKTRYGTLRLQGGMFLEGLFPTRGRLNITGEGLRIEYPQDVKSTVDVDIDFLKSSTNQLLTGAIYIRNGEYTKNVTLADLVLQISNFRALPPARAYGRQEINLDLDVEAYKTIRIKNGLADVLASGVFNVRGTVDEPVILGRMNVDQGRLVLQDSKYEISRGSVTFNNPRKTTPVLDFEAETNVRDYTVTINLRGPLDHLTTTFRSDPPLTTSDIVSMLAIGRPIQEVARDSRNREQQSQTLAFHGATTLLSRSLTDKLTARSSRLFGFDRFTIDPFLFTDRNPGARVTLGKQLSKDVAVIFATDLSSTQSEVVTIEYTIREGVTLVATRTETGAFGIDVKLRKRF